LKKAGSRYDFAIQPSYYLHKYHGVGVLVGITGTDVDVFVGITGIGVKVFVGIAGTGVEVSVGTGNKV